MEYFQTCCFFPPEMTLMFIEISKTKIRKFPLLVHSICIVWSVALFLVLLPAGIPSLSVTLLALLCDSQKLNFFFYKKENK